MESAYLIPGPIPLYYQLKQNVRAEIERGVYGPGDRLPSETEMIQRYGVSRITVRQALSELESEKIVVRRHGKGTFVAEHNIEQELVRLTDFVEDMELAGLAPSSQICSIKRESANTAVMKALNISTEEEVIRIERLRLADGMPIAYEIDYLPYPRAAKVYERAMEVAEGSLYALMSSEGLSPYIAEQLLKGDRASTAEAELLRVEPNEPGIRFTATIFDSTGAPVACTESFYVSARYEFQVTLRVTN